MKKIKAIIFDMDGVLIDAKEWHYEALNKALSMFNYIITQEEHLTIFDGLPTKKKLQILSDLKGLPIHLHIEIEKLKQLYTQEMINLYCMPINYHHEALSKLKELGYKLALASNSIKDTVELMMEKSQLNQYLDFKLSTRDVKTPKPSSEIYKLAISNFRLAPPECLILEDNENGIIAARNSGAHIMIIKDVSEVNFENIINKIQEIESNITENNHEN